MVKRIMHPAASVVRILTGPALEHGLCSAGVFWPRGLTGRLKSALVCIAEDGYASTEFAGKGFLGCVLLQPYEDSAKFGRRTVLA